METSTLPVLTQDSMDGTNGPAMPRAAPRGDSESPGVVIETGILPDSLKASISTTHSPHNLWLLLPRISSNGPQIYLSGVTPITSFPELYVSIYLYLKTHVFQVFLPSSNFAQPRPSMETAGVHSLGFAETFPVCDLI